MKHDTDICCTGDCGQGRACPRYSSTPSERTYRIVDRIVLGTLVLVVVGMVLDWSGVFA